ncbi:hypothetical protein [Pandoraea sp. NPDC087047]|uniref:hypothetical protein n=1 Tax=Pandoraea sp. NPDC087047 TaxID=3364390 RepID=UPI0038219682
MKIIRILALICWVSLLQCGLTVSALAFQGDTGAVAVEQAVAPRLDGTAVAYLVNQRYNNATSRCFVNSPVYDCSGLLLRTLPDGGSAGNFWQVSDTEVANGYATLIYARKDVPPSTLSNSVGFILADRPSAVGAGQPYELRCGDAPIGPALPPCVPHPTDPNAVGVSLWDVNHPALLAVQAIFYDASLPGQLAQALHYQRQYYVATGEMVPVLRAWFGAGAATSFGFDAKEQLDWGASLAEDLKNRYKDTRENCGGPNFPAFLCSGVLFRATEPSTQYDAWDPSPSSITRGGVSFAYMRADAKAYGFYAPRYSNGFIFTPYFRASAGMEQPEILCAFPYDAGTSSRAPPGGCGAQPSYPATSGPCQTLGITTAQQWYSNFKQVGEYSGGWSSKHAYNECGFSLAENYVNSAPIFYQMLLSVSMIPEFLHDVTDELIIKPWDPGIPGKLPLEAFFYVGAGLVNAQYDQQNFFSKTGKYVPIIHLTWPVNVNDNASFVFRVDEQVIGR